MITLDMLPISFVEGRGFIKLMAKVVPHFQVPSRHLISDRINLLYDLEKKKVLTKLERIEHWAFTTDCWTSRVNQSYITVTAHGINENWELVTYNLTTEKKSERHTSENLKNKLSEIISDFKLENKIMQLSTTMQLI